MIQEHLDADGTPVAVDPTHPLPAVTTFPTRAAAVVPDDEDRFSPRTIYVGTGGDVAIMPAGGGVVVTFTVPDGGVVPCLAIGVLATGTDAEDLVGVY